MSTGPAAVRSAWPASVAAAAASNEVALRRGPSRRPLGLLREPLPLDALCDASGRVRQLLHAGA